MGGAGGAGEGGGGGAGEGAGGGGGGGWRGRERGGGASHHVIRVYIPYIVNPSNERLPRPSTLGLMKKIHVH